MRLCIRKPLILLAFLDASSECLLEYQPDRPGCLGSHACASPCCDPCYQSRHIP